MLKTLENKNFMNYLDLLVKKTQLTETLDSGENLVTKMKERETKLFEEVGEIVQ